MELRHLRYFLAVGEALNFRKAAAQLRLAQPALSRQVQDLEDEIGVDLFRRSPRGVTLTAEGKVFLKEAREVLKHVDESVERARALARGEYGELHIGYSAIPTEEILPAANIFEDYGEGSVTEFGEEFSELLEAARARRADAARCHANC